MASIHSGAVVFSRERGPAGVLSTVEHRRVDGASVYLLAACRSELATPLVEGMKGVFSSLLADDERGAARVVGAAPAPLAAGAAAVVVAGDTLTAAASGSGQLYRQRGGRLEPLAPGRHPVAAGDVLLVSSHDLGATGADLLDASALSALPAAPGEFRHDALDSLLTRALERLEPSGPVAVAALTVG